MKVNGQNYKTVWMEGNTIYMIDQNLLPFEFNIISLENYTKSCLAIKDMTVRGAGAIGVTAGFAMAQAIFEANGNSEKILEAAEKIRSTRPTAKNLFYAVDRVLGAALNGTSEKAYQEAFRLASEDEDACKKIGIYGNSIITSTCKIATHCNAGWLAFVDYGSALSPIYEAHKAGKKIFVWVDETRPRLQGSRLTAWELQNEGISHSIIADNACAALMSLGEIDLMITGADRIAANGDTANKIGTLEKAIACKYYGIPFYVAAPLSTFDLSIKSGREIIIEERSEEEVLYADGIDNEGIRRKIRIASPCSGAYNPSFDVTPAELITGFITEEGICMAEANAIEKTAQKKNRQ